jgi:hypothetical protein
MGRVLARALGVDPDDEQAEAACVLVAETMALARGYFSSGKVK